MRTYKVPVPAVSTSLSDLVDQESDLCNGVLLQAPLENIQNIYFGENGREFAFIVNGGSSGLDVTNIRNIYVKGDPADYLIIIVY